MSERPPTISDVLLYVERNEDHEYLKKYKRFYLELCYEQTLAEGYEEIIENSDNTIKRNIASGHDWSYITEIIYKYKKEKAQEALNNTLKKIEKLSKKLKKIESSKYIQGVIKREKHRFW